MRVECKKSLTLGLILLVSFFIILAIMFSPVFNGVNAFVASDHLFNTISKGSTYYIEDMRAKVAAFPDEAADWTMELPNEQLREQAAAILTATGASVQAEGENLTLDIPLKTMLEAAITDSDDMFHNLSDKVSGRYDGMDAKTAMYTWWKIFSASDTALKLLERFATAALMADIKGRAIEVGYNYYGIEPQSAKSRMGILVFSLVFYVIYTMWFGYGIFYLFEGAGLKMKGGKKKEV